MNELEKTAMNLLYLVCCGLHGAKPEGLAGMDMAAVYRLAKDQSLAAVSYAALEGMDIGDDTLARSWEQDRNRTIRKNLLLDAGREEILAALEAAGIWYMPLKGALLHSLYPACGMRQMADNDILYDASRQKDVKAIMLALGYSAESVGKGVHDVYMKAPVYNYEMHTALFGFGVGQTVVRYYKDVKRRLLPDEGKKYGYHFTDEDFYVYVTAHAFKHFDNAGSSLRLLVDCYVYLWKKGSAMDWDYIRGELEKLGLTAFEGMCRTLSRKLFSSPGSLPELTEAEREMIAYCAGSGTYGTVKNTVVNRARNLQGDGKPISGRTKWKYCLRRIYPEQAWVEQAHPFFGRHRLLKPALAVYRIFRVLLFRRNQLKSEFQALDEL